MRKNSNRPKLYQIGMLTSHKNWLASFVHSLKLDFTAGQSDEDLRFWLKPKTVYSLDFK